MARVNVGVDPKYLADQHLVAESVEITMITGSLRKNGMTIKGDVPERFTLGKGHMNFFKDKLVYLNRRLVAVNHEMWRRGFRHSTSIDINEFPKKLVNDWKPSMPDTMVVRQRIVDKMVAKQPKKFWRHHRRYINNVDHWINSIINSPVHEV